MTGVLKKNRDRLWSLGRVNGVMLVVLGCKACLAVRETDFVSLVLSLTEPRITVLRAGSDNKQTALCLQIDRAKS